MIAHSLTYKILSIFFRLIIVLYAISIIYIKDNYFQTYWYYLAIIPYLGIFMLTLLKEGFWSKIRLLNDFIFIDFILYDKKIEFATFVFLMLPVINSPNHSGQKKSFLLYVFFISSLIFLTRFDFYFSFLFITLILYIINLITESRNKYYSNIDALNKSIDNFLEKELELKKTFKIYSGLLKTLNSIKFLKLYKPNFTNIICLKIDNNNINIENSATFVWSLKTEDDFIELVNDKTSKEDFDEDLLSNINIEINHIQENNNFCLINETKKSKYVFLFIIDSNSNTVFNLYYINLLKSVTSRISRVVDLENSLKTENKKMLNDFRIKYFHVQNAEKAMHFIRNRFNTLDNFIEMSKDNINGKMDSEDLKMYKTELERLERNYNILMERVKTILNKSDKPFSAAQLENKTSNYLFNTVREIWLDYFDNFNFELNWDLNKIDLYTININPDGLYILLSDWIVNQKKYSSNEQIVLFKENDDFYDVIFRNNFQKELKNEILDLKDDFNSKGRDKILLRTSHGILIMKSILEEMNLQGLIEVYENHYIELKISFKKQTK